MKIDEIAKKHDWSGTSLAFFARNNGFHVKENILGDATIDDSYVDKLVKMYEEQAEKKRQEEVKAAEEKALKQAELSNILITSGFNFDGYRVIKYSGYISGDDAVEFPRESGFLDRNNKADEGLMAALSVIRRNALNELKEAAFALGCNAVIGVDFDYITLEPETANFNGGTLYLPYVFGVTANGNAVVIEKIDE